MATLPPSPTATSTPPARPDATTTTSTPSPTARRLSTIFSSFDNSANNLSTALHILNERAPHHEVPQHHVTQRQAAAKQLMRAPVTTPRGNSDFGLLNDAAASHYLCGLWAPPPARLTVAILSFHDSDATATALVTVTSRPGLWAPLVLPVSQGRGAEHRAKTFSAVVRKLDQVVAYLGTHPAMKIHRSVLLACPWSTRGGITTNNVRQWLHDHHHSTPTMMTDSVLARRIRILEYLACRIEAVTDCHRRTAVNALTGCLNGTPSTAVLGALATSAKRLWTAARIASGAANEQVAASDCLLVVSAALALLPSPPDPLLVYAIADELDLAPLHTSPGGSVQIASAACLWSLTSGLWHTFRATKLADWKRIMSRQDLDRCDDCDITVLTQRPLRVPPPDHLTNSDPTTGLCDWCYRRHTTDRCGVFHRFYPRPCMDKVNEEDALHKRHGLHIRPRVAVTCFPRCRYGNRCGTSVYSRLGSLAPAATDGDDITGAPLAARAASLFRRTPGQICNFCLKPNHIEDDCMSKRGLLPARQTRHLGQNLNHAEDDGPAGRRGHDGVIINVAMASAPRTVRATLNDASAIRREREGRGRISKAKERLQQKKLSAAGGDRLRSIVNPSLVNPSSAETPSATKVSPPPSSAVALATQLVRDLGSPKPKDYQRPRRTEARGADEDKENQAPPTSRLQSLTHDSADEYDQWTAAATDPTEAKRLIRALRGDARRWLSHQQTRKINPAKEGLKSDDARRATRDQGKRAPPTTPSLTPSRTSADAAASDPVTRRRRRPAPTAAPKAASPPTTDEAATIDNSNDFDEIVIDSDDDDDSDAPLLPPRGENTSPLTLATDSDGDTGSEDDDSLRIHAAAADLEISDDLAAETQPAADLEISDDLAAEIQKLERLPLPKGPAPRAATKPLVTMEAEAQAAEARREQPAADAPAVTFGQQLHDAGSTGPAAVLDQVLARGDLAAYSRIATPAVGHAAVDLLLDTGLRFCSIRKDTIEHLALTLDGTTAHSCIKFYPPGTLAPDGPLSTPAAKPYHTAYVVLKFGDIGLASVPFIIDDRDCGIDGLGQHFLDSWNVTLDVCLPLFGDRCACKCVYARTSLTNLTSRHLHRKEWSAARQKFIHTYMPTTKETSPPFRLRARHQQ